VRRRRIAGEAAPAAPAKKAAVKKAAVKKPVAKKARPTTAKAAPAAKTVPSTTAAPTAKAAPTKKAPAKAAPAKAAAASASAGAPAVATPAARRATRPVAPQVPTRSSSTSKAAKPAERAPGSRPSRRDLLWLVPATLLSLASLVVGVFLVINPPGSGDDLDTSRRQASSAAAGAAETIFSFRYDQLDQHLKASKALMTPAFAKEFDSIAPALTELAPQRKIVVQAAAREAAALPCGDECSATKADVLVFVDQARLVGDATQPTVFANRIKVSMVKGDDGWRVANIRAL
jgi:hypothetical protein